MRRLAQRRRGSHGRRIFAMTWERVPVGAWRTYAAGDVK